MIISRLQTQISYGMQARYEQKIKEMAVIHKNPVLEHNEFYQEIMDKTNSFIDINGNKINL